MDINMTYRESDIAPCENDLPIKTWFLPWQSWINRRARRAVHAGNYADETLADWWDWALMIFLSTSLATLWWTNIAMENHHF